jgi:leucyl aminopeptidase
MEKMKYDMAGGATMRGVMRALAALKPNVKVICVVPSTENMPGGTAQKPGDIQTAMSGKTIEVLNTDAEGRLILADALARASEDAPALLLDFATLTGAARTALGPDIPPFYANDDALAAEFASASNETSDPLWRMPLWDAYEGDMDSPIADLKNTGVPPKSPASLHAVPGGPMSPPENAMTPP